MASLVTSEVLRWDAITPRFGSELIGTQLSSLDAAGATHLLSLVGERGVVVARDQSMTISEQIALAKMLGPIYVHPAFSDADHPEAIVIHADEKSTAAGGETWHSDVSSEPTPPAISILRMEDVPPSGGDTAFADMYQAFESLSPSVQDFILRLNARHESPSYFASGPRVLRDIPASVHPVVRTHPVTGKRALFVNVGFTKRIVELSRRESDAVLRMLFDHVAYGVDRQLRASWAPSTVVLWDNRCVQHHAVFDYFPAVRHGYRVSTVGERPQLRATTEELVGTG